MQEIHLILVDNNPVCYMLYDLNQLGYQRVLVPDEVPSGAKVKRIIICTIAVEEALFKLEFTEEGTILRQYIEYLQAKGSW